MIPPEIRTAFKKTITAEIDAAFDFAKSSPFPNTDDLGRYVYAKNRSANLLTPGTSSDRFVTYAEALNEAQAYALEHIDGVYLMGLGVPDPKGIFGSTLGLPERFGEGKVFDVPISENALTGVALGSAVTGQRPILTHQRVDFTLVSIDQIVNQAAKWHYMFGGHMSAPMVIRMIIAGAGARGHSIARRCTLGLRMCPGQKW